MSDPLTDAQRAEIRRLLEQPGDSALFWLTMLFAGGGVVGFVWCITRWVLHFREIVCQ